MVDSGEPISKVTESRFNGGENLFRVNQGDGGQEGFSELLRIISQGETGDAREALIKLAESEGKRSRRQREERYISNFGKDEDKRKQLKERYEQVNVEQVDKEIKGRTSKIIENERKSGRKIDGWEIEFLIETKALKFEDLTEEEKQRYELWRSQMERPPDDESKEIIEETLRHQIELLFLNKETGGSYNQEKFDMVIKYSNRLLEFLFQAQKEGSISQVSSGDFFKLTRDTISSLSFQDKVASEVLLGDHGVRHLIGHNAEIADKLALQLKEKGVPISVMDRIILQLTAAYHDLGYAMPQVRDPIKQKGINGQDAGHNVLAAKYLSERMNIDDDLWLKIFGEANLDILHRCILYHDKDENGKASVKFNIKKELSLEERIQNLESITRVADNTHAFEDKLPEILYRIPESLRIMRFLKTAARLGDKELIDSLKNQLKTIITNYEDLSSDDKEALLFAVGQLNGESWRFNVSRVCGNKPEIKIDEEGKLEIKVDVSEIHQEVIGIFFGEKGQSYSQLIKMIKDVYEDNLSIDKDFSEIFTSKDGHKLVVKKEGISDYQEKIRGLLLADPDFNSFINEESHYLNLLQVKEKELSEILSQPDLEERNYKITEIKKEIEEIRNYLKQEILKLTGQTQSSQIN